MNINKFKYYKQICQTIFYFNDAPLAPYCHAKYSTYEIWKQSALAIVDSVQSNKNHTHLHNLIRTLLLSNLDITVPKHI